MEKTILAIFLLLSGCAGGGGSVHNPPSSIRYGMPTELKLEVSVWGAGSGKIINRYKNVTCHYRLGLNQEFKQINMAPDAVSPEQLNARDRLTFKCTLPAIQPQEGKAVEYYFDMIFDGVYNSRPPVKVELQ